MSPLTALRGLTARHHAVAVSLLLVWGALGLAAAGTDGAAEDGEAGGGAQACGLDPVGEANRFQQPTSPNGASLAQVHNRPSPRAYHSGLAGYQPGAEMAILVLLGGCSPVTSKGLAYGDLWFLDMVANVFYDVSLVPGSPRPGPRFGHDAAWIDANQTQMVVFGGEPPVSWPAPSCPVYLPDC